MIDLIASLLDRRGFIPASRFGACNIYIGKNLVFHAFDRRGDFIVVKVRRTADAETEFAAHQLAYEAMPELVPRPLALDRVRDMYLLSTEGVPHTVVGQRGLDRHGSALAEAMRRFIDHAASQFVPEDEPRPHSATVADMIGWLGGAEAETLRRVVNELDLDGLDRLPHVSQHGDLVINNLGRVDHGIVIFDWEDFGRVTLPGFDVALLICSCLGHDMARIEQLFETGQPYFLAEILSYFCSGGDVGREMFRRLLPVYYGFFLELKRSMGYGSAIIETSRHNIHLAYRPADPD